MKFKKISLSVPLFIILFLAAFLRIVTLSKLMVFGPDEEYILYITATLVKHVHIIWIGVSALGFDFYMGPGLEYFLMPFLWLSKGDPVIWGVITCFSGVVTSYLIYWFGQKIFSKKTGLLAALIYASSALLVYYDQQPYPSAVPLLSMGMLISLYMTKYKKSWWIVFLVLFGIVFHIHLSLLLVFFVGLYWALTHKDTWNLKTVLASLFAFLVVISPLIGFDYFHKFSNITAPIRVVQAFGKNKSSSNLASRTGSLVKAFSRVWYLDIGKDNAGEILYPCNADVGNNATTAKWPIVLLILVLFAIYFRKKDVFKNDVKKLLFVYSLAFLVPFLFLSSVGSVEYYLLGFFPVFILIISYVITSFKWPVRYLFYFLIFIFVLYNIITVFGANGNYGLAVKRKAVGDVMQIIGEKSYSLSETGTTCKRFAGWGYLFSIYGRPPENNIVDRQFSWLLPIGDKSKTDYSVLIDESVDRTKESGYKYKLIEGGFTVYIFAN